jgi:hypothetical protein
VLLWRYVHVGLLTTTAVYLLIYLSINHPDVQGGASGADRSTWPTLPLIVSLSGGVDSMVISHLLHLMARRGLPLHLAADVQRRDRRNKKAFRNKASQSINKGEWFCSNFYIYLLDLQNVEVSLARSRLRDPQPTPHS